MFKKGQLVKYMGNYYVVGAVLDRTVRLQHRTGFSEWAPKSEIEIISSTYILTYKK